MHKRKGHHSSHHSGEYAPNASYTDGHPMENPMKMSSHGEKAFHVNPIGEKTPNGNYSHPNDVHYAMHQTSNGSMDYLERHDRHANEDAKKISSHFYTKR